MSNTLYLECLTGISGDMTVAALLDLGADQNTLEQVLKSLSINGFKIIISRVKKSGLDVCDFHVALDQAHENHDHDMDYLHGHHHQHHEHHHHHEHRGLPEILEIIKQAQMTERAKQIASDIFSILGAAEAKAHGVPQNEVHFHEVGAVDSIVDIVAVAVCLDNLDVTEVIVPKLSEGQGTVRCQHGVIPVPVPAVAHIVESHGIRLQITDIQGELVTPTGAAIVAAVTTTSTLPKEFTIKRCGMGAGKRNYEQASILRAMLIEAEEKSGDTIYKLESNLDDCTGETLGYTMERLFSEGARDVHYTPVFMKKNRPAYQLNVICTADDVEKLEQIILEETTTIGIRRIQVERTVVKREVKTITTTLGMAEVKICLVHGKKKIYPEYESVVTLCRINHLPYKEVWDLVRAEAKEEGL